MFPIPSADSIEILLADDQPSDPDIPVTTRPAPKLV
jgi:hypothetical protein